jgi:sodium/hydrogen exchanger 10/11
MAICSALAGVMAKFVFTYEWSWFVALMFGSIISATDPVAVVSLLNELGRLLSRGIILGSSELIDSNTFFSGVSKQLSTLIEGESLLNDGMAIVLYKIFYNLSFSSMTGKCAYSFSSVAYEKEFISLTLPNTAGFPRVLRFLPINKR